MHDTAPYKIEPLFHLRAHHGEAPVWDPVHRHCYWADLLEGQFFRADWETGVIDTHVVGQPIGVLALRQRGGVVLALRDGFYAYDLHTRELTEIREVEKDNDQTRFNDGAVDPRGRFWAGTMTWDGTKPIGNMYCLEADGAVTTKITGIYLSNGIAWSGREDAFFHTDTMANRIDRYVYDAATGNITHRERFIDFGADGYPDGITLDERDHLWIAMWGGGSLRHYDAEGQLVESIPLPMTYPTSCCFGGPKLDELIVTTSRRELSPDQRASEPLAGRCLRLRVGVRGRAEPRWAG